MLDFGWRDGRDTRDTGYDWFTETVRESNQPVKKSDGPPTTSFSTSTKVAHYFLLPGLTREQISVTIGEDNGLEITIKNGDSEKKYSYVINHTCVDLNSAKSTYQNGTLSVVFTKAVGKKKIEIPVN